MLEYGQPLHTFDYDRITGGRIIVRRAGQGERFITLDNKERELTHDMLVISDAARTVAIAGVMGGLNTEVSDTTTSILVEAASFKAASIHFTSHHLDLRSEASTRFERGISAEMTIPALRHATQLIAELGGGTVARGLIDLYPGKKEPPAIKVSVEKAGRLIGFPYTAEQVIDSLTALGFSCTARGDIVTAVTPPWRSDIKYDVDLIEEVARIIGYDKIPMTLLGVPLPHQMPDPLLALRKQIRHCLVGYGFQEIMTYTLTSMEILQRLTPERRKPEPLPVHIVNPMSAEQEYLRPTLRGNLLATLAANRRFEDGGIALFELGKVFYARDKDLPAEPEFVAGVMAGERVPRSWLPGDGKYEFYDVKGLLEGFFKHLKVNVSFEASDDPGLHPTRQTAVMIKDKDMSIKLGVAGEVHPAVADAFGLEETVCLFEINIPRLTPFATGLIRYQPVPRFPAIIRDLALVVDSHVSQRQVMEIIDDFPLVTEIKLFDVYTGKQVGEGKKSLAYRLVYQSATHTLTDEEVNRVQEQILRRLAAEVGATLRLQ